MTRDDLFNVTPTYNLWIIIIIPSTLLQDLFHCFLDQGIYLLPAEKPHLARCWEICVAFASREI